MPVVGAEQVGAALESGNEWYLGFSHSTREGCEGPRKGLRTCSSISCEGLDPGGDIGAFPILL